MQIVPITSITVSPERQRAIFDPRALAELMDSISAHGLLHAPVCRDTPDGPVLVAGERRMRAIDALGMTGGAYTYNGEPIPPGQIPYVTLGELTPFEAEEAELDENLKREDLTWQEKAAALARLHSLRQVQATARGEKHTLLATVQEIFPTEQPNRASLKLRDNITISQHLSDPDVQKAKHVDEAIKIVKKKEAAQRSTELAERIGRTFNSAIHNLVHENCLAWLDDQPDNQFDVILTDPPYGMDADKFGDGSGRLSNNEHHYQDSYENWQQLMGDWCEKAYRVAKAEAHAYIFCDFDRFHELKLYMQTAGWYVFRTPFVSYKPNSGRVPLPDRGPRRQYELILYAIKGEKKVNAIYSDVLSSNLEVSLLHGAQKPVSLYIDLLRRSVVAGNVVLDCFAGSGTIFPAAHYWKCKAVGVEMSAEYYGLAAARLAALDDEPELL